MRRIVNLLAAAWLVSWQPVPNATHYAVERDSVQVAYGPGLQYVDTTIVSGGFYTYRQRVIGGEWDGAYTNERCAQYVDLSRGSDAPQMRSVYLRDDSALVMVALPSSSWDCEVSNTFTVFAWTDSDFNGDGWVNLSDLALTVEAYYGTADWLPRLARFAMDYNRPARAWWP